MTSGTVIRMQPCEARVPIEPGSPVPWMPTPFATPIQRAFSGFSEEPPATVSLRYAPAHGLFGAVHGGLTALLAMLNRPRGVGYAGWPTATPYDFENFSRLN